ncbi:hypothetical protein K503DRAFT_783172 [Rhizopogon vinicolor AM-OR11-026]|uniref:Uncharacterized protein n=1 Tax=Rhizopogon vinicolor AM-OR11-026 TaxID=1314800 RepID=A0A1B7MZM2_9AGAM|nr:hypothetical protein K503DRAFT_783172 [Rhizopogon vinicolor AM-OR11-026]
MPARVRSTCTCCTTWIGSSTPHPDLKHHKCSSSGTPRSSSFTVSLGLLYRLHAPYTFCWHMKPGQFACLVIIAGTANPIMGIGPPNQTVRVTIITRMPSRFRITAIPVANAIYEY